MVWTCSLGGAGGTEGGIVGLRSGLLCCLCG